MDAEKCEFLAGDETIEIIPKLNADEIHLISADVGPFEAGVGTRVPLWLALLLRKKHYCTIVTPNWLSPDELRRYLVAETENAGLTELPNYFFEIAHILVREAYEDLLESDLVKTLVQDLWDRREAKLRTSIVKFLSQKNVSHARLDYVQPTEVVAARPTLAACKQIARLVANIHDSQQTHT